MPPTLSRETGTFTDVGVHFNVHAARDWGSIPGDLYLFRSRVEQLRQNQFYFPANRTRPPPAQRLFHPFIVLLFLRRHRDVLGWFIHPRLLPRMHVTVAQVPTQSLKIFSPATSVPTSYSHTYAPERSLIQALGADDLFSAAQRI